MKKTIEEEKAEARAQMKVEGRVITARTLRAELESVKSKFGEGAGGSIRGDVSLVAVKKYLAIIAEAVIAILEND